jgi:hypothetical protein
MLKAIAVAALMLGASMTASTAAPISGTTSKALAGAQQDDVETSSQQRRHWRGKRHYRHWDRRRGPPPGWRRHNTRPWDWQRRGCIQIGPLWFCP